MYRPGAMDRIGLDLYLVLTELVGDNFRICTSGVQMEFLSINFLHFRLDHDTY